MEAPVSQTSGIVPRRTWRFYAGVLAGFVIPLLLAEFQARVRPPTDLQQYLGEASSLTGDYRSDPALGADYRSYADFQHDYNDRLRELGPIDSEQSTWLWFGNSFVQAPGMLGDTSQATLPGTRMFYLKRNEPLYIRAAQARLLLQNGLRPQHLVFVILPIDVVGLGWQPISTVYVTQRGAITRRARLPPGPLGGLIDHSRLALLAWVRSGRAAALPSFHGSQVNTAMPASIASDLQAIVHVLGDASRQYHVPVTVMMLPNREQIYGKEPFGMQDAITRMCAAEGIDCFDPRDVIVNDQDKASLFLPDWHFTPRGNQMLFAALQTHFEEMKKKGDAQP